VNDQSETNRFGYPQNDSVRSDTALIKGIKPYLDERYVVGAQSADLYAYFYERGVRILRNGGRLGFITSATFFRTSSGEPLRAFLTDGLAIEAIVDFGDAPVFSGVTTELPPESETGRIE
jgi:hypothetical protein